MTDRVLAVGTSRGNVVLDLDGCVYVGGAAVPGARRALLDLAERSYRLVVATNNSTRHPRDVREHVRRLVGVDIPEAAIVTSGRAALHLLSPSDLPVLLVGEEGLRRTLHEASIASTDDPGEAGSVLVGLDRQFDYDTLRRAMEAILQGARFLATNGDATFPTDGIPVPGAGSIVAAVERASGVTPVFAGKPHPAMRAALASALSDAPTWVVGDRLDTDVALGKAAGWPTVLVLTGVTSPGDDIPPDLTPDHVLDSVADLPALLP